MKHLTHDDVMPGLFGGVGTYYLIRGRVGGEYVVRTAGGTLHATPSPTAAAYWRTEADALAWMADHPAHVGLASHEVVSADLPRDGRD